MQNIFKLARNTKGNKEKVYKYIKQSWKDERKRPLFNWTGDISMDDTQRWLKCSTLLQVSYMEELITINQINQIKCILNSKRKEAEEYVEKVNI